MRDAIRGFAQKCASGPVRVGGLLTLAQRFIAGKRGIRNEVRETDD